jgi:hypothetical protein
MACDQQKSWMHCHPLARGFSALTEEQLMTEREKALLGGFGEYLRRTLPEATNSTAEVIWRTGEGGKWKVSWTLSVSKSHTANVHILHRANVPGIEEKLAIFHKAVNYKAAVGSPRIFSNGLVVGGILEKAVPRAFMYLDKEPMWLGQVGGADTSGSADSFQAIVTTALSDKKSPIRDLFSKLRNSHEYKALKVKFPRYILVAPVLGRTIVVVSSCSCPSKSLNFLELVEGRTYKRELALADQKKLQNSLQLYSVLSNLSKQHFVDFAANTNMLPIVKLNLLMPMLLTLEAVRLSEHPESTALTMRELIGEAPPERLEGLIQRYAEIVASGG